MLSPRSPAAWPGTHWFCFAAAGSRPAAAPSPHACPRTPRCWSPRGAVCPAHRPSAALPFLLLILGPRSKPLRFPFCCSHSHCPRPGWSPPAGTWHRSLRQALVHSHQLYLHLSSSSSIIAPFCGLCTRELCHAHPQGAPCAPHPPETGARAQPQLPAWPGSLPPGEGSARSVGSGWDPAGGRGVRSTRGQHPWEGSSGGRRCPSTPPLQPHGTGMVLPDRVPWCPRYLLLAPTTPCAAGAAERCGFLTPSSAVQGNKSAGRDGGEQKPTPKGWREPLPAALTAPQGSCPAPLQPRISQDASSSPRCLPSSTDNKCYAYHWQKLKRWGKKIQSYTPCAHKSSLAFVGKKPPRFRVLPSFKSRVFAQRCHLTQHHLGSRLSHRGLLVEHSRHRVQACKPASNLRCGESPAVVPVALLPVGRVLAGPRGAGTGQGCSGPKPSFPLRSSC